MANVKRNDNRGGLVARLVTGAGRVRARITSGARRAQLGPTNRLDWRLL